LAGVCGVSFLNVVKRFVEYNIRKALLQKEGLSCVFDYFSIITSTVAKQERFNVQEAINGDVELKEKQEKNGHMEVAVNTGKFNRQNVTYSGQTHAYDYAYPFTDYQQKTGAQLTDFLPYSLSLNNVCPDSVGHRLSTLSLFHSNIPYTIQFQANKLPDVNKVFLIGNKQYLCEKIETEIDVDGLSKVLKGTFYRIE
jgi:hypothetical protein